LVLEGFFGSMGYFGVFIAVFLLNVVPAFTPPTWMVLSLIYISDSHYFTPMLLALVGCIASTLGRFVLSYVGTASRSIIGAHRKRSLDVLHKAIGSKRGGGFLVSFMVALSPFPSNAYFITIGMMKYQALQVFLGFMFGRFFSYWYLVSLTHVVAHSLGDLFSNELYSIVIIDLIGLVYAILVMLVDWDKLIEEKHFGIIRPRLKPSDKEETH
jgi:membrane protein DedA with SNARE-associated domain